MRKLKGWLWRRRIRRATIVLMSLDRAMTGLSRKHRDRFWWDFIKSPAARWEALDQVLSAADMPRQIRKMRRAMRKYRPAPPRPQPKVKVVAPPAEPKPEEKPDAVPTL